DLPVAHRQPQPRARRGRGLEMTAEPVLLGHPSDDALTTQLLEPVWTAASRAWWICLAATALGTLGLLFAVAYTLSTGIGVWGNNIPVGWAFGIINFVWWIGIGHAGTFISAVLLLLLQKWRTTINRFTEAMTLFAVICAGLFPLLHLGRPWIFYFMLPIPDTMALWPQFRSPLIW